MIVFMVLVTGAAVSLAAFNLGRALVGFTPEFDCSTVEKTGLCGAFALYCGAGPVLLLRALEPSAGGTTSIRSRNFFLSVLMIVWTGALGIVAVESLATLL